jgi:hypothetical protein
MIINALHFYYTENLAKYRKKLALIMLVELGPGLVPGYLGLLTNVCKTTRLLLRKVSKFLIRRVLNPVLACEAL